MSLDIIEILKEHIIDSKHIDVYGHLNNGEYTNYIDANRTALQQKYGIGDETLLQWNLGLVASISHIHYFKELKAHDKIKIHTRMLGRDRNFVYMRHNMLRGEDSVNVGLFQSTFVEYLNRKIDLNTKKQISVNSAAEKVEHLGNLIIKLPKINLWRELTKLRKLAMAREEPLII